jgi:hypothetical protein
VNVVPMPCDALERDDSVVADLGPCHHSSRITGLGLRGPDHCLPAMLMQERCGSKPFYSRFAAETS